MNNVIKYVYQRTRLSFLYEVKRFAGHAKWQNIKHIKEENDGQRMRLISACIRKLQISIIQGNSIDPEENLRLKQALEYARKMEVPIATINNFMKKQKENKEKIGAHYLESRGPGGSLVLIHVLTNNLPHFRNSFNTLLKRAGFSPSEVYSKNTFIEKGIIQAKADADLDKATEDAIVAGAEEVDIVNEYDENYFQFICEISEVMNVRNQLEQLNYEISSVDNVFLPKLGIRLNEDQKDVLNKLYEKLKTVDAVDRVYDNTIEED